MALPPHEPLAAQIAALPPLPTAFYERPTTQVAHDLLGKLLIARLPGRPLQAARLTEVEAYLGLQDAASHARRGPTRRAAIMFGPPARLYVYLIYGMHHCMNVVCEPDGVAGAVLLRAAEPLVGFAEFGERHLSGPGRLCAGFAITRAQNGVQLDVPDRLYLADDGQPPPTMGISARIGIGEAGAWKDAPLRFYAQGHRSVSGPRRPKKSM